MIKRRLTSWKRLAVFGLMLMLGSGCDTGVRPSPDPGILRLELRSNLGQDEIRIAGNQFVLGNDTTKAALLLDISQAVAYRDTNRAKLTRNLRSVEAGETAIDVLQGSARRLSGTEQTYTLYESFLPPAEYDSLQMAIQADRFVIQSRNRGFSFTRDDEGLTLRPDLDAAFSFSARDTAEAASAFPFEVTEHDTTIVRLEIDPLGSLERSVDQYYFAPQIKVANVIYREGER